MKLILKMKILHGRYFIVKCLILYFYSSFLFNIWKIKLFTFLNSFFFVLSELITHNKIHFFYQLDWVITNRSSLLILHFEHNNYQEWHFLILRHCPLLIFWFFSLLYNHIFLVSLTLHLITEIVPRFFTDSLQ